MKYLLIAALLCVTILATTGCLQAPVVPPMGVIYSDVKAPLDVDADSTAATGKKGTASSTNILWLVAVGDASVKAAAEQGGITKIDHVDYEFSNILFFFSKYTTIVYGQ